MWNALEAFDFDSRHALFAYRIAPSVKAIHESYNRRPRTLFQTERLAQAADLDLVAACSIPTVETYLGHVTKARFGCDKAGRDGGH